MMQMELIIEQINTNISRIILVKDLICNLINTFSIETSKIQILSLSTIDISQKKKKYHTNLLYIYIHTHIWLKKKRLSLCFCRFKQYKIMSWLPYVLVR